MYKKVLAMVLTAAMAMGTLVACGDEPTSTPASNPTPTVAPATDPTDAPDATEKEAAWHDAFNGADLKGVTIKTNNLTDPAAADESVREIYEGRQAVVEEKFNVKMEFSALGDTIWEEVPNAILTSVAAGTPICDIFRPSRYYIASFMLNDLIEDITDTVLEYGLPESYYAHCWWNDRIIGFDHTPLMTYEHIIYDRGIILDIGMEKTPSEMFVEGKWSWDDFYDYLREMKSKLPDEYMPFYSHPWRFTRRGVAANGQSLMDSKNNLPLYNTEPYYETVAFLKKLMDEGLAKAPHVTGTGDDGTPTYSLGQGTYVFGEDLVMTDGFNWNYSLESYTNMDWGIVPYPWGPRVTFNEDFTSIDDMLEGYYSTNHDQSYYAIVKGRGTGLAKAAAEDYMNMMFVYQESYGKQLLVNLEREEEGLMPVDAEYGTERYFQTELDIALYDWYRSGVPTLFNPYDTLYPSGQSTLEYNAALQLALTTDTSPRTAFEAIYASDCAKMIDSGLLDKSLLDPEMLEEIEDILEQMAEEEAAAEEEEAE